MKKERKIQFDGWVKNEQGYPEFVVLSQYFKECEVLLPWLLLKDYLDLMILFAVSKKIVVRENRYTVRPYAPTPRERCDCDWTFWGDKNKMCAHQKFVKDLILTSTRERVA